MQDSSFGRLVGVLVSPTRTFSAIAEKPTWVVALVVLLLLGALSGYLITERLDFEEITRDALARQSRQMSEEDIENIIAMQEKFGVVFGVVNPVILGAGFYFLAALIFWVSFKLVGGEFRYMTGLATTLHGFMPALVAGLLNIPVILGRSELDIEDLQAGGNLLASNLGVLAPEDASPVVRSALASADLFSLWSIVLMTIGFSIVAGTSRKSAAVTVVTIWILGVALKVGWAALTQG